MYERKKDEHRNGEEKERLCEEKYKSITKIERREKERLTLYFINVKERKKTEKEGGESICTCTSWP